MSAGFYSEAGRTVNRVGADSWIVAKGVSGPFTAQASFDRAATLGVQRVKRVDPLVIFPATVHIGSSIEGVNVIGHPLDGLGAPKPSSGRSPAQRGEVLVDARVGAGSGHQIELAGRTFTVTGVVHGSTCFGGIPVVYTALEDAQDIAFGGRQAAPALVTTGHPTSVPPELTVLSNTDVYRDVTLPITVTGAAYIALPILAVAVGLVASLAAIRRAMRWRTARACCGKRSAPA